ncbi:hydroxymethylpyrimidine/phosphomethylpyrimidine kinase [Aquimarina sp. U1-2]|uniref:hydroxymethylpyrimidine/phosphomethylpyrimidine kinase n=1 Tax=Aquimarina sp. U1-2 TaxID=2823141 RepID=UPI001AECD20C|nr:hydroxymethylpyrimidine/phosphomethylpyrimidine kinase [Aquimarina sp. U1-2]MBP2831374.1 hydroxymethylpyrimidine/phosphomethylpyrimidine kinase [Aquimarina sp. U1-2]
MKSRPCALTIAGFDPSSGAGVTADIKTFEALKVYGLAVCTANTIQTDINFKACYWVNIEIIKTQIEILFNRFKIDVVKIGIVQNWEVLHKIIDILLQKNPKVKIVLDPVLKASSSFEFHNLSSETQEKSEKRFEVILNKVYLLTPNYHEIKALFLSKSVEETIKYIHNKTNVLLKGGHIKDNVGIDHFFIHNGNHFVLNPKGKNISDKHGSGCILSSAITAYLALGFPILKACFKAKRYTEQILRSNKTLLGYHRI